MSPGTENAIKLIMFYFNLRLIGYKVAFFFLFFSSSFFFFFFYQPMRKTQKSDAIVNDFRHSVENCSVRKVCSDSFWTVDRIDLASLIVGVVVAVHELPHLVFFLLKTQGK